MYLPLLFLFFIHELTNIFLHEDELEVTTLSVKVAKIYISVDNDFQFEYLSLDYYDDGKNVDA